MECTFSVNPCKHLQCSTHPSADPDMNLTFSASSGTVLHFKLGIGILSLFTYPNYMYRYTPCQNVWHGSKSVTTSKSKWLIKKKAHLPELSIRNIFHKNFMDWSILQEIMKNNNTETIVPSSQRPSVLYWILSDFKSIHFFPSLIRTQQLWRSSKENGYNQLAHPAYAQLHVLSPHYIKRAQNWKLASWSFHRLESKLTSTWLITTIISTDSIPNSNSAALEIK